MNQYFFPYEFKTKLRTRVDNSSLEIEIVQQELIKMNVQFTMKSMRKTCIRKTMPTFNTFFISL